MTPPRRRSARLASANTPKPKAKSTLSSVAERDDTPPSKSVAESLNALVVPNHDPATPSTSAELKAPLSEMHPSKVHPTVAPPSATWLGFRDMKPSDKATDPQATPSKTTGVPESPFTFRVTQPSGDSGLSSDAQKMMNELREEAARIKADLIAKRELEREDEELNGRKIATAKGKSSRFSAAHMAEFKKMDSIEGHASSFRAQPGRVTPLKSSLKRSQSKANLEDTPTHPNSSLKRSPSKANLDDTPTHPKSILKQPSKPNLLAAGTPSQKSSLKRSPSKANLDDVESNDFKKTSIGPRARIFALIEPPSSVKRVRQRFEDDTSTARPVSRDGSSLPRPKSSSGTDAPSGLRSQPSLTSLVSPTKSSLARASGSKMPLPSSLAKSSSKPDLRGLAKSPSKAELGSLRKSPSKPELGALTKSATTNNLGALEKTAELKRRIVSPGRFERVKSILRGGKGAIDKPKSAIPQPAAGTSQTPAPQPAEKSVPAIPFTTPRRKLFKRVEFTPDTHRAADVPNTVAHKPFSAVSPILKQGEVHYPNLDAVLGNVTQRKKDDGLYPDLTVESPSTRVDESSKALPPTVPGTFTFRSDHTIRFGSASPTGFGSTAGQSSIRHVRRSLDMPGGFPPASDTLSNKENRSPMQFLAGKPHGMSNKKRARAREEEGDLEEASGERAGKRRKAEPVPEGDALLAPRLVGATPNTVGKKAQAPRVFSPSPTKKRTGMSLSRLNMLAKPKSIRSTSRELSSLRRVIGESHDGGEEHRVPRDSTVYVSMADPLGRPAFKPSPTKPIPTWMQPYKQAINQNNEEWSEGSVITQPLLGYAQTPATSMSGSSTTETTRSLTPTYPQTSSPRSSSTTPQVWSPPELKRAQPLSWVSHEPLKRPSSRLAARLEKSGTTTSSGYVTPPETPTEQTSRYKTPPPQLRSIRPRSLLAPARISRPNAFRRTPPPQSSEYLERYNPIRSPSPRPPTRELAVVALRRASRAGPSLGLTREAVESNESRSKRERERLTVDGADSPHEGVKKKMVWRRVFGAK
ncbi:uncharacterized protein CTRU02_212661 [Colletotrichum truncatum]|uniref:Uncharacterized protein n=1 Tax=Colletotrichum truncatum TaxID=5467 RepID=A0ACC3YII2_COLTU|nr:uncharacterized protein CTRU02_05266 [Colletotrichum truncatum]KAF6794434.1 hypothetical protein CTRU02_05266 [Colletotrichum truncatum]